MAALTTTLLVLAAAAMMQMLPGIEAHGYLADPAAQFVDSTKSTFYVKTIDETVNVTAFGGKKWDDSPEANTQTFKTAFGAAGYSSLRAFIDQQVSDCANTRIDVAPVDVSGKKTLHWQNDQAQEGFVSSHHGPCEVWIDDVLVNHKDDCRATYTSYPANVDADFAECSGSCTLRFYWLALHEPKWQIYKQCVPITNSNFGHSDAVAVGVPVAAEADTDVGAGTVSPANTDDNYRALRSTVENGAPAELENGQAIDWTDHRFLQAFQSFASEFFADNKS